jgi:hypothetical protein
LKKTCWHAVRKGWLTPGEFVRIRTGLAESGLPVWVDELERTRGDVLERFSTACANSRAPRW